VSAAPDPATHPAPGQIIAGKYQIEEVLGHGGMGVVVAARHVALRQRVAVKFLPEAAHLPEATARFLREAQAAVAIQSEHVARVIDVGTLETGAPYMVMEYLAGSDLGRVLKVRRRLPVADAVDYVIQACEALAEAHMHGIIHRDLKPGNLFLTQRAEGSPLVKVLDFGLSKLVLEGEQAPTALTATAVVIGSPHYMSPEQVRSLKYVDRGTDIWALGVILHEMLTGKRPFDGPSLTAICASIVMDPVPPLETHRADLPEGLDAVVRGCLEKDLTRRTRSVAELAARLSPYAPPRSAPILERIGKLSAMSRAQSHDASPGPEDDEEPATIALATDADGSLVLSSAIQVVGEAGRPPPAPSLAAARDAAPSSPEPMAAFSSSSLVAPAPATPPAPTFGGPTFGAQTGAPAIGAPTFGAPTFGAPTFGEPAPTPAAPPGPVATTDAFTSSQRLSEASEAWGHGPPRRRVSPGAMVAGACALLGCLGVVAWLASGSDQAAAPPSASAAPAAPRESAAPAAPPPVPTPPAPPPAASTAAPSAVASAVPSMRPSTPPSPPKSPPKVGSASAGTPPKPPPRRGGNPLDRSD
jgi:serine/threonine-protein kinase